jgi:hypothetical protein
VTGGIIFTVAGVPLRDQFGCRVICTSCGGDLFDITSVGRSGERIECSNAECGRPVLPGPGAADPAAADTAAGG